MGTAGGISRAEAGIAYDAAQKVVEAHRRLSGFLHAGLTLSQVDIFVAQTLEALGCRSCFLGYRVPRSPPFPSHACLSVNDCVVHGTAGYTLAPLKEGDVLKVDIGVLYRGWVGDAAWTYFIGEPAPLARGLGECGKEALKRGIETLRPENTYLRWAQVVQDFVERQCGFHLVRGLGGHGYGRKVHQSPFVSNVVSLHPGEWPDALTRCAPGTLVAVEPMIAAGTGRTRQKRHEWPVFTADGSIAVHYEHDVLITEEGPRVLTEGLEEIPDVI